MNTFRFRLAMRPAWWVAALLATSGCATSTLERANRDYASKFAQVANEQLLMNLYRLSMDQPAYYIQLGNFSAQFSYGVTLGPLAGAGFTRSKGVPYGGQAPTAGFAWGPTASGTYSESPSFNFTPLSGDALTKAVFQPLPNNIFSIVFNAWHADVAIRTAVNSVTIAPDEDDKKGQAHRLNLKNDPRDATYPLFLAIAYEVRQAQIAHLFPAPYPSDAETALADKAVARAKKSAVTVYDIKLADKTSAEAAGYTIENLPPDKSQPQRHGYSIYKTPAAETNTVEMKFPDEALLADYPLLQCIVHQHEHVSVSLRTFDGILYGVAKEEGRFFGMHSNREGDGLPPGQAEMLPGFAVSAFGHDHGEGEGYSADIAIHQAGASVPGFKARPILRMAHYKPVAPFVCYPPDKPVFSIGDSAISNPAAGEKPKADFDLADRDNSEVTPSCSNSNEFTLLAYLFNAASIDSTKLPVQQLVEVR